jgi:hypothetical protein
MIPTEKARRRQVDRNPDQPAGDPNFYPPVLDLLAPGMPEIQYLGDPHLINALLRNFLAKAIDAQIEDQETGTKSVELVMAQEAQKCAKIVLGLDPDYVVISPEWNGNGLLMAIRRRWNLTEGNAMDIASVPFYALVEAYQTALELEIAGQEWDHVIDGAVELSTHVLMGTEAMMNA